ncbi:MAG: hypothetical protein HY301_16930 [Verrucomicrobia bacterium]|nr:hypothetical protein [Verrucomicrobiota bacterium]
MKLAPYDAKVFRPDPAYPDSAYSAEAQLQIYGDKRAVPTTRPLIELGRELYREGPFQQAPTLLGKKNLVFANLLVSGDWRTAVAYNDTGAREFSTAATRVNLDVDLKFTATERIHAFFRPLDKGGNFTGYEFGAAHNHGKFHFDGNPDALFFEGDLGAIGVGVTGRESRCDLPFTFGLIPLIFQNGIWLEDAFVGAAFTIPARNSRVLDWANFDLTFFAGIDRVTSPAFVSGGKVDDSHARVFGAAAFVEAMQGYWEFGYAYLAGEKNLGNASYHNLTASFTRRYFNRVSNSLRVVGNAGQSGQPGMGKTANGVLFLVENSLVTSRPSTVVPYANFFVGVDKPQSVARDAGAGGILKNTGILFETDGLTGFPTLDATGHDAWGAALGLEFLPGLKQQIVLEAAMVRIMGGERAFGRPAKGDQYGLGIRYQLPLTQSWILRADAMIGWRDADQDLAGARIEMRYKF